MSPTHVLQLPAFFFLHLLVINVLFCLLLDVEAVGFDDGDVGGGADVVRRGMLFTVCALVGPGYLEQPHER